MINSFTDLKTWQEAHQLSLLIYIITERFPKEEMYGLTSQIRRAAISVTSNIAEGFGRSGKKDKEHFYVMADGSLYEVKSQLILGKDLGYINPEDYKKVVEQANVAHKLLHGLIRSHKSKSQLPTPNSGEA